MLSASYPGKSAFAAQEGRGYDDRGKENYSAFGSCHSRIEFIRQPEPDISASHSGLSLASDDQCGILTAFRIGAERV